jgi:hypothetical protein
MATVRNTLVRLRNAHTATTTTTLTIAHLTASMGLAIFPAASLLAPAHGTAPTTAAPVLEVVS